MLTPEERRGRRWRLVVLPVTLPLLLAALACYAVAWLLEATGGQRLN